MVTTDGLAVISLVDFPVFLAAFPGEDSRFGASLAVMSLVDFPVFLAALPGEDSGFGASPLLESCLSLW